MTALAGCVPTPESLVHAQHRPHAGAHVKQRNRHPGRRPAVLAGDADDPAVGLQERVVAGLPGPRADRTEPGHLDVDQPRVEPAQFARAEPGAGQRTRAQVVHKHIRGGDQVLQDPQAAGVLVVQRQRLLVPIQGQEGYALVIPVRRRPAAAVVSCAHPLNLDHFGAEITEDLAGHRRGHAGADLDDPYAPQRAGGLFPLRAHRAVSSFMIAASTPSRAAERIGAFHGAGAPA